MGKSKRNKEGRGGGAADDQPDVGTDADSVASMSTALSDLQLPQQYDYVIFAHIVFSLYLYLQGLLAMTLGPGSSSHEIMDESHPQLLRILQTWPDASKMISALDCLAVVTFVGATDLAETQLSLKAIWDVIHPKSGSNVGIIRKPKPPLLAAAVSAWAFLLTTVGSSRRNTDSWKELVKDSSIISGECPEETLRLSGKNGILRVTSWHESIQLNYLRRFLGRGFLKHAQDNDLLHDIFDIKMDRIENMSNTEKKIFRSEEEKGRALKLNKERRLAQERKQNILDEQYG
nr:unnamed protein product [Digitaria exilis]